jgi:hypothetical protein
MIVLNSWNDFDESKLKYRDFIFDENYFDKISFKNLKNEIEFSTK